MRRRQPVDDWLGTRSCVTVERSGHDRIVQTVKVGLSLRALRRRRGWTQAELGRRAMLSGSAVSRLERGGVDRLTLRSLERVATELGARVDLRILWRGEELDRLLDAGHARLVERTLELVTSSGWIAVPEVSFNLRGERGSIDVLAHHPATRSLLTVEVKSVVPDLQATLAGIDRKARLAPQLARDRGWWGGSVSRLLVLPDDRTARRRVAAFDMTFRTALPGRTIEARRWLRSPSAAFAGILFLPAVPDTGGRHRVARRRNAGDRGSAAGC